MANSREWIDTASRSFDTGLSMNLPFTTLTRWKLAAGLLAAIAGYALFIRSTGPDNTPAEAATIRESRSGGIPNSLRRPLRIVGGEIGGMSKADLAEKLLEARTVKDVSVVAEKLAVVGDDSTIQAAMPLLRDTRRGVPEAILSMIGQIGTEHAVEILIAHATDDRPSVRNTAIGALGATQSREAEKLLLEI